MKLILFLFLVSAIFVPYSDSYRFKEKRVTTDTRTIYENGKRLRRSTSKENESNSIEQGILSEINEIRRNHGVKPLKLNSKLSKKAKKLAEKLAKSKNPEKELKKAKKYSKNTYYRTSSKDLKISAKDAVDNWYEKERYYNYEKEPSAKDLIKAGQFTKMVWKDTTDLGVGVGYSKDKKKAYIVTFYSPQGNWFGQFSEQVFPKSDRPIKEKELKSPKKPLSMDDFQRRFLEAHNKLRAKHHVDPLEYDKQLIKDCEDWAKHLARKNKMFHSKMKDYGENLYFAWSTLPGWQPKPEDAVNNWYDEVNVYKYGLDRYNPSVVGHFTQLVWKNSKKLGVGMAKSAQGRYFVVARYDPKGNIRKKYTANVLPP